MPESDRKLSLLDLAVLGLIGAVLGAGRFAGTTVVSGVRLVAKLPGGRGVEQGISQVERALFDTVASRLQADVEDDGELPLRAYMSDLLQRSAVIGADTHHDYLFGAIIEQLVPDEARILAALSSGASFAAADLVVGGRLRGRDRVVLRNASIVGRDADVAFRDHVPHYLSRLHDEGLIEFGPEGNGRDLVAQYERLAVDPTVQAVERGSEGSVRMIRKTVSISPLGQRFWAAADPSLDD